MNFAECAIKYRVLSFIVMVLSVAGGWSAYQSMPRFEDPEFTIRTALIYTAYPGASPRQVAEEITRPLETALQELPEVDAIKAASSAGASVIHVDIKYEFSKSKSDLQSIWTKLRNKVNDAAARLPSEAAKPIVNDDFGDVYGFYYLLTGEGYSKAELRRYAKELRMDLLQVDGVAKVSLLGEEQEAIYVEIARPRAARLGVSQNDLYNQLARQNAVAPAGEVEINQRRLAIHPSGGISSVAAIENLLVAVSEDGGLVHLKDIASVHRGYKTPPTKLIRYDGKPALAIGASNVSGANVVKVGEAISQKISDAEARRPLGMELHEFYHQGKVVDSAVRQFFANVVAAFVIVWLTLLIFMGARTAGIIGAVLLLTISATLATMEMAGIPLHRISLGALIIALGMMVDNAIVVAEGMLIGIQRGDSKMAVAKRVVDRAKWPLLGGTAVGIIAFAPIGFAPGDTAEYTGHLFWVVLIALSFSWIFAVTLTPLFCFYILRPQHEDRTNRAAEKFFAVYKNMMRAALNYRWPLVAAVFLLFAAAIWSWRYVTPGFFPLSTSPLVAVDYWLPPNTDIFRTREDMKKIEAHVASLEGVAEVQTLIGGGALRFVLIYGPEADDPSYGQILAKVDDYKKIDALMPRIQSFMDDQFPDGQGKVWRFVLGPGGGSKIEAQFQGVDPAVLRKLSARAKEIMIADGGAFFIKDDWRDPVPVIQPIYSEQKGARIGVSREDLAAALQTNFSGRQVGTYRESDDLIPIISRAPADERAGINGIRDIFVVSAVTGKAVPIAQVADDFRTVWRDGKLRRENQLWTIKAQSDPLPGNLAGKLFNRVRQPIEAIELPSGHTLEWKGEYGNSTEANENLASVIPFGLLAMALIVLVLFNAVRQPLIIWLVVPLAVIGVAAGLLLTGTPMEFMGILGLLSLSGLMIKNAIVLIDQIDADIADGQPRWTAVVEAAASRVRPVMMGSLTTVLGVIPLFFDAFFQSLSVVLVFGLSFATLLTLVVAPVLYAIFFNIQNTEIHNAQ